MSDIIIVWTGENGKRQVTRCRTRERMDMWVNVLWRAGIEVTDVIVEGEES